MNPRVTRAVVPGLTAAVDLAACPEQAADKAAQQTSPPQVNPAAAATIAAAAPMTLGSGV
jgi:hypothetical protein